MGRERESGEWGVDSRENSTQHPELRGLCNLLVVTMHNPCKLIAKPYYAKVHTIESGERESGEREWGEWGEWGVDSRENSTQHPELPGLCNTGKYVAVKLTFTKLTLVLN